MKVDVAVVGAGVAGAVCAIELCRAGHSVALVDAEDQASPRVGDCLAPDGFAALVALGLGDCVHASRPVRAAVLRSAFGSPELVDRDHIFGVYGAAWHVDRVSLDRALRLRANDSGARSLTARVDRISGEAGAWSLHGRQGKLALSASFLVDATGRAARLARRLGGAIERHDRAIAVVSWASAEVEPWGLVESTRHGWWYSGPAGRDRSVVMLVTDAPLWRQLTWSAAMQEAPRTWARVRTLPLCRPRVHDCASQHSVGVEEPRRGWVAIGDAARASDPLTGSGLTDAIRSAVRAARRLSGLQTTAGPSLLGYLARRRATYQLEQRWPEEPFWARRHAAP